MPRKVGQLVLLKLSWNFRNCCTSEQSTIDRFWRWSVPGFVRKRRKERDIVY